MASSSSSSLLPLSSVKSQLLSLLGSPWHLVSSFLSSSPLLKGREDVHRYPALGKREACEYRNYRGLGLSFCTEKGEVEAIHVYNGTQNFVKYQGELPHGLRVDMTNMEVVTVLGEPDTKFGGSRKGPITIGYENKGLQIAFVGDSWDDVNNPIDCITLYRMEK